MKGEKVPGGEQIMVVGGRKCQGGEGLRGEKVCKPSSPDFTLAITYINIYIFRQ